MKVTIIVPGIPVPKGRPRFGNGRTYTPEATRDYEELVAWHARKAMAGHAPMAGPVALSMLAVLPIPKAWPKKRVAACCDVPEWHIGGKDLDNLIKAASDACNGIVFVDDGQVAWLKDCRKVYGLEPRIEMTVELLVSRPKSMAQIAYEVAERSLPLRRDFDGLTKKEKAVWAAVARTVVKAHKKAALCRVR